MFPTFPNFGHLENNGCPKLGIYGNEKEYMAFAKNSKPVVITDFSAPIGSFLCAGQNGHENVQIRTLNCV